MSQDWITKYGPRRVRRDPPTLDEAIFAAIGITDDQQQQAEIAAALMRLPFDEVLAEVKKQSRANARATTRVIAGEQGAQRSVVVERPWSDDSATTSAPARQSHSCCLGVTSAAEITTATSIIPNSRIRRTWASRKACLRAKALQ